LLLYSDQNVIIRLTISVSLILKQANDLRCVVGRELAHFDQLVKLR